MILSFFIVYIKSIYLHCCVHRAPTTATLSQVVHAANRKKRWYSLANVTNYVDIDCRQSWKPKVPQDESHVCDQSHHNNQPLYQRLALVGKKSRSDVTFPVQLMLEHAEDLWYKPCATTDLRRPCHTSKCPTWHPTQQSTLLCHWMHLNANATWQSQWQWLPQ